MRNLFAASTLLFLTACAQLQPGTYQSRTLYNADLAITTAYDAIHTFVLWEYQNRMTLAQFPEVKKFADGLRKEAPGMFTSAIAMREAYATNPSGTNAQNLTKALALLRTAMVEATKYLIAHQ